MTTMLDPYAPGPLRDYLLDLARAIVKEPPGCDTRGCHSEADAVHISDDRADVAFACAAHDPYSYWLPVNTGVRDVVDSLQHLYATKSPGLVDIIATRLGKTLFT